MIYITPFRANDLNPSKGRQIEFNSKIVADFFKFTEKKHYINLECLSLKDPSIKVDIKAKLTLSEKRGDYKIYQNEDGSPDLKDFFLSTIGLTQENNLYDYYAIKKVDDANYKLIYIPKGSPILDFLKNQKDDLILFNKDKEKAPLGNQKISGLQCIFYGAPGTGKSHHIKTHVDSDNIIRTTFHPDTDYSTFVGAYKPTMGKEDIKVSLPNYEQTIPAEKETIVYKFVHQSFLEAYIKAWKLFGQGDNNKVYLVIEEINRGNCAQIFGDLFQLLDRNDEGFSEYEIRADKDLQVHLQKELADAVISDNELKDFKPGTADRIKSGEVLILPNNLYIWATMNTSDQSLFPIDSAFKRRWDWKYMPIYKAKEGLKIQIKGKQYDWWGFLEKINQRIFDVTASEDKKLGFFFCKSTGQTIDAERFVDKVIFYLWNDVFKDYDDKNTLFTDNEGNPIPFDKYYEVVGDGDTRVVDKYIEAFMENLDLKEDAPETEEE